MKKIFVLSWFYPPINSSESFVTYKLLSHSKFDYDVWMRSGASASIWDRKTQEAEMKSKNINVLEGPSVSIGEWAEAAYQYFVQHADEYDAVMTRSMPPEAHSVGKRIKENFPNIKWIASYGDPLVGTPYLEVDKSKNPYLLKKYIEDEKPSRLKTLKLAVSPMRNAQKMVWSKKQKALGMDIDYSKINDFTLRLADVVIVNNEYQLDHVFSGKYAGLKYKGLVIPHSFDEKMYSKTKEEKNRKIVFTYTGHLDDIRNAGALLLALADLAKRDKDLADKIEVDFYGHLADKDKLIIINHELCDIVKLKGDVSYAESLGIMKKSDWLLLFDANFNGQMEKNIYFPAKLADYIGAAKNIFAVTQLEGASADIVRRIGNGVVCTHSKDEIEMYLAKIIYKGYKSGEINEAERAAFKAEEVAKILDAKIQELLK